MVDELIQALSHVHVVHDDALLVWVKLSALLAREVNEDECELLFLVRFDEVLVELYFVQEAVIKIEQHQNSLSNQVSILCFFTRHYLIKH